jgi:triphosphoribosyl-dephospho-CoA synthase
MNTRTKSISLSRGAAATLACVWEATAPKPGNVYPGADFDDVSYGDFLTSAVVIGPSLERTREAGVGQTVLDAVRATQDAVGTNTNLGTLLLLAPLAAIPDGEPYEAGIEQVLAALTYHDTQCVYSAIRSSGAGGLGTTRKADVFDDVPPGLQLVDAMRMASDADLVARQYTNGFADVVRGTAEWIAEGIARNWPLTVAIVHAHLRSLAKHGDSLIGRKCGQKTSDEASERAARALAAGLPGDHAYASAVAEYDRWLRDDGHRRNPGTTADLIAAGLFVLLRDGRVQLKTNQTSHAAGLSPAPGKHGKLRNSRE